MAENDAKPAAAGGGCPCCSGATYAACCQPYHAGAAAPDPESLMRSRYSAYVLRLPEYIRATWYPQTRPLDLDVHNSPRWCALQVLSAAQRGNHGEVSFRAVYEAGQGWGCLEERSTFALVDGRWYYADGETRDASYRPGRNDRCPCGSGKKYKTCCMG